MERRKAEIEQKRQKLAELIKARENRRSILLSEQQARREGSTSASSLHIRDRKEIDDLVSSLVGDTDRSITPTTNPSSVGESRPHSSLGQENASEANSQATLIATPVPSTGPRYTPDFEIVETVIFDIPPKEHVFYSKEIQTTENSFQPEPPTEEEIRAKLKKEQEQLEKEIRELEAQNEAEKKIMEIPDLTPQEKEIILTSKDFVNFLTQTGKVVERALSESYDFMKDYTISEDVDSDAASGRKIKCTHVFFDDKLTKGRSVTDVDWSPKFSELSLASYSKNPMEANDVDGLVLIWNLHLKERPEFTFYAQSDVLSATFSKFHPNLIIGGTYSGQVLIWDTRAKSFPVLKTPMSATGHTHPIYSMSMVGTQNAHNLITASTDGLVCSWQLDMLAQPQESLELLNSSHSKLDEVSVTSLGFPANETDTFWVGTEEGNLYRGNRYDRAGSKAGLNQQDIYKGHVGPITSLDFHPLVGPVDFSDLIISTSVDWTVKMWRANDAHTTVTSSNTTTTSNSSTGRLGAQPTRTIQPLYSFEAFDDYVFDAKWSPVHPAIFATVDGAGKFNILNLNQDTEVPVASDLVGNSTRALNRLAWDREGKLVSVGSSDGNVYIYDIGEMALPRSNDWNDFQKRVSEMLTTNEQEVGR